MHSSFSFSFLVIYFFSSRLLFFSFPSVENTLFLPCSKFLIVLYLYSYFLHCAILHFIGCLNFIFYDFLFFSAGLLLSFPFFPLLFTLPFLLSFFILHALCYFLVIYIQQDLVNPNFTPIYSTEFS